MTDTSPPPAPPEPKLIVVVGATGNQGGSVARRFLRAGFRVRGLTRDPSSPAARALAALGADMHRVDLLPDLPDPAAAPDNPSAPDPAAGSSLDPALARAFAGANVIFAVTDYWAPFRDDFHPARNNNHNDDDITSPPAAGDERRASSLSLRAYAGRVEAAIGRNIADAAAATLHTLEGDGRGRGLIASTLSHAGRCSGGRLRELYHFDAKADVFPGYVRERHPALAERMSCVQTGFFMTSHRILPESYFAKQDGTFEMRFCTDPHKPVPQLDPVADMGNFVHAVYQMAGARGARAPRDYMAAGTTCTWPEWIAAWSRATGAPARYRQIPRDDMARDCGGGDFGGEIADMFEYCSDPGYDGGQSLVDARDLREAGIECPMTSLDEWMARQDWSAILSKPLAATQ